MQVHAKCSTLKRKKLVHIEREGLAPSLKECKSFKGNLLFKLTYDFKGDTMLDEILHKDEDSYDPAQKDDLSKEEEDNKVKINYNALLLSFISHITGR